MPYTLMRHALMRHAVIRHTVMVYAIESRTPRARRRPVGQLRRMPWRSILRWTYSSPMLFSPS